MKLRDMKRWANLVYCQMVVPFGKWVIGFALLLDLFIVISAGLLGIGYLCYWSGVQKWTFVSDFDFSANIFDIFGLGNLITIMVSLSSIIVIAVIAIAQGITQVIFKSQKKIVAQGS